MVGQYGQESGQLPNSSHGMFHQLASNNPFRNISQQSQAPPTYEAPPGPPPSHQGSKEPEPPPYDPWLAVPDTALLPPPPSFREERSPTANADYNDAARAHAWCRQNPLWPMGSHSQKALLRATDHDIRLTAAPKAKHVSVKQMTLGKTHVRTTAQCTDTIFLSDIPIYAAATLSSTTIYYELRVISMDSGLGGGDVDAGIAIGYVAPPYPHWRLPGWHRGSVGVHGDDGRRYVDNSFGGRDFTSSFSNGDVVGLGMTFSPPSYAGAKPGCKVFFTRNGQLNGGWDLHEERDGDSDEGDVTGLEGGHDILAAVGCFGSVEFEAVFHPDQWLYRLG